ncbi:MAG: GTPase Era [Alphaproteobacteria bacterium]
MTDLQDARQKCGFAAVIGAPNAGKSTLINHLVGAKVSIVTHKVQTTRTRVLGIAVADETQVVFVDTPGIFMPKKRLDRAMVGAAWQGAKDADLVLLLVDAQAGVTKDVAAIVDKLHDDKRQAVLVLNKVDGMKRDKLLGLTAALNEKHEFTDTFMISALNGSGTDDLMAFIVCRMPEGPWLFLDDQLSDMPQRLLAAEITREKLFLNVHQELPYALTVETDTWKNTKDGGVRIEQTIYVQRESQRSILLGKGGSKIKTIGSAARHELSGILECPVHLFLFVKVRDGWQDDPERYRVWNLDFDT